MSRFHWRTPTPRYKETTRDSSKALYYLQFFSLSQAIIQHLCSFLCFCFFFHLYRVFFFHHFLFISVLSFFLSLTRYSLSEKILSSDTTLSHHTFKDHKWLVRWARKEKHNSQRPPQIVWCSLNINSSPPPPPFVCLSFYIQALASTFTTIIVSPCTLCPPTLFLL